MVVYNRVQAQKQIRANLQSRGYHAEMLKEEKGRYIDMYWHRDRVNSDGDLGYKVGWKEVHQSTLKDSQDRMNVRGLTQAQVDDGYLSMLPWPPSATCSCRTCRETFTQSSSDFRGGIGVDKLEAPDSQLKCDQCDYVATGTPKQQPVRLNLHRKKHGQRTTTPE